MNKPYGSWSHQINIEGRINSGQGTLHLFVTIIALACVCMGLTGYVAYLRLDNVAGHAVFVSPYFESVVIFCGLALYAARSSGKHARWWTAAVIGTIVLARMAPLWSEAWISGRIVSANCVTVLVLLGAAATLLLRSGAKRKALPIEKGALAVALLGVSVSTLIAYALIEDSIATRQKFARASSQAIASDIQHKITQTAALIQRLAERLSAIEHMPAQAFVEHEFSSHLQGFSFLHGFAVIDANQAVVWGQSQRGLASEWIQSLTADAGLQDWLVRVGNSGQAHIAPIRQGLRGGSAEIMVAPLSNSDMRGWFVVALVDLASLLTEAAAPGEEFGYFRISNGGRVLYQTAGNLPTRAFAAGDISIPVHHNIALRLAYTYTKKHSDVDGDILPEFVLLAGILFTFFLIASQRLAYLARERSEQLRYSALHDHLTGLPNRRMLEQTLHDACAWAKSQGSSVSVVFFDLDGIKLINDSMGHNVGDGVLVEVANRLQRSVQNDGSVTRIGGDEFVLLFLGMGLEQVQEHTQRAITTLSKPYLITGRILRVTASAGIGISNGDVQDPMQLVREADLAMLRAKQEGRNTWRTYTADMSASVAESLELRNDLQTALDTGGLELHYQPIVEGYSGRVIGVEALVRWPHPVHGYISPARVIPLAEETGQIVPLTNWVLASACRDSGILRKQGLPSFPVIVNISPLYFQRINFVQSIQQVLLQAALPAEFLEIEITEGVLLENQDAVILKLTQLRELGIKTSIDDFGTGYSSLSYLKNLPIDKVKIDRSFVVDVVSDPADAAIAQGIISMAHHLGLKVVAEGVETESQFAFLKRSHCDEFQGYLFARPMAFDALTAMLSENSCRVLPLQPQNESVGERVLLLVDDEKNILSALTRLLRRDGYRILTANSPAVAFELLAKHKVQVIMSDQRMPEMNGTAFFSKVKDMYPDTIRMILSGYTDLKSVTEAINHGAIYKFITKPWDDDALRQDVEHAFKEAG